MKTLEETIIEFRPIFEPGFLCHPNDDAEAVVLERIRNHYLPDCILAYNSVLFFAGHAISRSWLVQCMELAQKVAQSQNLTRAFVASGRMRELVHAFAVDSQALLQANEQGHNRGKPTKKEKGIDIWQVQWKEDGGDLDLEAVD